MKRSFTITVELDEQQTQQFSDGQHVAILIQMAPTQAEPAFVLARTLPYPAIVSAIAEAQAAIEEGDNDNL